VGLEFFPGAVSKDIISTHIHKTQSNIAHTNIDRHGIHTAKNNTHPKKKTLQVRLAAGRLAGHAVGSTCGLQALSNVKHRRTWIQQRQGVGVKQTSA